MSDIYQSSFQGEKRTIKGKDIYILYPKGDMDSVAFPYFEKFVLSVLEKGFRRILINFSDVNYLNSASLGILIRAMDACDEAGGWLALTDMKAKILTIMNTLSLDTVFKIYSTEEEALRTLAG